MADWLLVTVGRIHPAFDDLGESDYGGLDEFAVEGATRRLTGEIGELVITCGGQNLVLDPAS